MKIDTFSKQVLQDTNIRRLERYQKLLSVGWRAICSGCGKRGPFDYTLSVEKTEEKKQELGQRKESIE